MVKKQLLLLAALLPFSSFSYSEVVTGQARISAYDWVMTQVLPAETSLTVSSVIYNYTVSKETSSAFVVTVANENPAGGYTFRSVDDWTGLPGNTIRKVTPVDRIPLSAWGDGSITSTGFGTVSDPSVVYVYSYTPSSSLSDAEKLALVPPPSFSDGSESEPPPLAVEEDSEDLPPPSEEEEEESLEERLGLVNDTLLAAASELAAQQLFALNGLPVSYYSSLPGGTYKESIAYGSAQMPSNPAGRRVSFAQQLKHKEMVEMQYQSKQEK